MNIERYRELIRLIRANYSALDSTAEQNLDYYALKSLNELEASIEQDYAEHVALKTAITVLDKRKHTSSLIYTTEENDNIGVYKVFHINKQRIGTIYCEIDGYYVFDFDYKMPGGYWDENVLYSIANALFNLNKEWDAIVRTELSPGKEIIDGVKYEYLPSYGDLIQMNTFIAACEGGGFIDYDGHGYYAFKDKMTNILVRPSDLKKGKLNKSYPYVMWFNR